MIRNKLYLASFIGTLFLVGCGTTDSQAVFTSAAPRQSSTLAAPPGLSSPDLSSNYKMNQPNQLDTNYQLSSIKGMQVMTGGSQRWLVIESSTVDNIWPELTEYINQLGLTVKYQNRSIGVMQTDWATRNNKVPQGATIRGIFQWIGWGSMYSLDSMYMFHITVWQDGNNVVIMDTNYQMDEEYEGCQSPGIANTYTYASSEQQRTKWISRGSNPQLELEFIGQFMAFLGTPEPKVQEVIKQATEAPKNAVYQNNSVIVNDQFDRTWWRAAIALDRVSLGIADKNRSQGTYDVYPLLSSVDNPDPGFLSKWFSDESGTVNTPPKSKYVVKITPSGNQTIITLQPYGNSEDKDFAKEQKKYLEGIATQLQ